MRAVPPRTAQGGVSFADEAKKVNARPAGDGCHLDEHTQSVLLERILENVTQGIAVFDADLRLVVFNRNYQELFDYPDSLLRPGVSYEDIIRFTADRRGRDEEDAARYVQERVAQARSAVAGRREHVRSNGTVIAIRSTPTPDGGLINTYTDITSRKQAEAEAERNALVLKATLENMADGVRVFDQDLRLIACNKRSLDMFGFPPGYGEIGTPYDAFVNFNLRRGDYGDCSAEARQARIERARRGVVSTREHELADGRVIQKTRNPMPGGGFVTTYTDITARKQAERVLSEQAEKLKQALAELQRSNSELEQFAYVASHDLQEPLRMVASYCQLLQRRYSAKLDEDANEFIGFAVEGAKRMQTLINDLLLYSRVGTQGKPFAATGLEQTVMDALANLSVAAEEAHAEITHDPLPVVQGDEVQLLQLLQNLIGNSLKFRDAAPVRIHLGAQREGDEWVISVTDNGIGVEPQYAERIFMIFQRLHTRDQYPGTGIGLSVCKKIVERHGGRIWVEPAPTKGSVFKFTIPA